MHPLDQIMCQLPKWDTQKPVIATVPVIAKPKNPGTDQSVFPFPTRLA
jgi:hypothetical protein